MNQKHPQYQDYGGAGISVCEAWLKFENFLADMGECPPGLELDRINNALGYNKENCRWATEVQQSINRDLFRNNTSGVTGVSLVRGKWQAEIKRNGKTKYLGYFETLEEAAAARRLAEEKLE